MTMHAPLPDDRARTWGEVEAYAVKLRQRSRAYRCALACAVLLSLDRDDFDHLMQPAPRSREGAR